MNISLQDKDFDTAVSIVSAELKRYLINIPVSVKNETYEVRMRAGKPLILSGKYGCVFLKSSSRTSYSPDESIIVTPEMLSDTFNRLCCYSVHTHLPSLLNGYITMQGGHRVGVAASAVTDSTGLITSVKDVSSVNIRISRAIMGCADEIYDSLFSEFPQSIIIAGPPSSGKTTVLRDLIRQLSGDARGKLYKVCAVDERQEIAAMNGNIPQNDVGINCDILSGFPKTRAIVNSVKTMSPDIIAVDEVVLDSEIDAITQGVNSGVKFIVSVHASDYNEILHREQIIRLINTYSFSALVLLDKPDAPKRIKGIYDVRELRDEIIRSRLSLGQHVFSGNNEGFTA